MKRLLLGLSIVFLLLVSSGCSYLKNENIVPPEDLSLEKTIDINLKQLDLAKMTKQEIMSINQIQFGKDTKAYEISYRYPKEPIKVKIAKFENNRTTAEFWYNWKESSKKQFQISNSREIENESGADWTFVTESQSVEAWYKNNWLIVIEVPYENTKSNQLRQKVKEIILSHFSELNKQHLAKR